jgi:hypothetical protein
MIPECTRVHPDAADRGKKIHEAQLAGLCSRKRLYRQIRSVAPSWSRLSQMPLKGDGARPHHDMRGTAPGHAHLPRGADVPPGQGSHRHPRGHPWSHTLPAPSSVFGYSWDKHNIFYCAGRISLTCQPAATASSTLPKGGKEGECRITDPPPRIGKQTGAPRGRSGRKVEIVYPLSNVNTRLLESILPSHDHPGEFKTPFDGDATILLHK